jgi:hypothetical protein
VQLRTARIVLRAVGVLALLFAAFGLWYNTGSFVAFQSGAFDAPIPAFDTPYFRPAYLILSSVCVACFLVLACCGVQFLRLASTLWWLFTATAVVEVFFIFIVGAAWLHPVYGASIAAASGVSGGGLRPQWLLLFPIWGPVTVWFARRALLRG